MLALLVLFLGATIYRTGSATKSPRAENPLSSDIAIEKQVLQEVAPRPFVNEIRGHTPSAFVPQTLIARQSHRHANYFHNGVSFKLDQDVPWPEEDVFHAYKPQDPGDVNLMATEGYRFAPTLTARPHAPRHIVRTSHNETQDQRMLKMTLHLYSPNSKTQTNLMTKLYNKLKVQDEVAIPFYTSGNNWTKVGDGVVMNLNVFPDVFDAPDYRQLIPEEAFFGVDDSQT